MSPPVDKYDGLKIKNKTIPFSKVVKGSLSGVEFGSAGGLAGTSLIIHAAVGIASTAGGCLGYQKDGDTGAAIGSILGGIGGASAIDKYHRAYPERIRPNPEHVGYEEIPNGSLVNGGTVIAKGRKTTSKKKFRYKTITHKIN